MRRLRWAALGCAVATGTLALVTYLLDLDYGGALDALSTLLPVPIAFACGLTCRRTVGIAACLWMTITLEVTAGGLNPFVVVVTMGPWLVGYLVQERQRMTRQLEEVGQAIEAESQVLAEEAVRLERARIARELHDIVAHCVSVMVVQAYAGERLANDSASATEAFENIAAAARQAEHEIAHLVDLLDTDSPDRAASQLGTALEGLVAGAVATGLDVRLHLSGQPDHVTGVAGTVAYRVVQEGVTNAMKHAPGAPIHISVACRDEVVVDVFNEAGSDRSAPLRDAGGGHGLSGIRERIAGLGGTFEAGPEPAGCWRVSVRFPAILTG